MKTLPDDAINGAAVVARRSKVPSITSERARCTNAVGCIPARRDANERIARAVKEISAEPRRNNADVAITEPGHFPFTPFGAGIPADRGLLVRGGRKNKTGDMTSSGVFNCGRYMFRGGGKGARGISNSDVLSRRAVVDNSREREHSGKEEEDRSEGIVFLMA